MKIGIDLGGSHIAIGQVEEGKIKEKIEIEITEIDKTNIEEFIEQNILKTLEKFEEKEKIETIGIAVPGTVAKNKIIKSVNLNIENYDIVEKIEKQLKEKNKDTNIKIKLGNDAKCATIAEKKYGCLKEYENSIFLTLGTGIGGATIINNKLMTAKNVPGYEFGHMTINYTDKEKCKCGKNGCFEQYASMKAFKNKLKKELELKEYISGEQLLEILKYNKALNKNDEKIEKVINEFTEHLAIGISNLINIFEPEVIGIGGSYVYFEEFIAEGLRNVIKTFNKREKIVIKTAKLGNEAGIIGASLIVQEEL